MKFEGIMPALITPLNSDETVNTGVLKALIGHLLAKGADGGIGSTYNFQLEIIKSVYTHFKNGDLKKAHEEQMRANRIISVLLQYKTIPVTKVVLEAMGFAVGNAAFPMKRYSLQEKEMILSDFQKAGLVIG